MPASLTASHASKRAALERSMERRTVKNNQPKVKQPTPGPRTGNRLPSPRYLEPVPRHKRLGRGPIGPGATPFDIQVCSTPLPHSVSWGAARAEFPRSVSLPLPLVLLLPLWILIWFLKVMPGNTLRTLLNACASWLKILAVILCAPRPVMSDKNQKHWFYRLTATEQLEKDQTYLESLIQELPEQQWMRFQTWSCLILHHQTSAKNRARLMINCSSKVQIIKWSPFEPHTSLTRYQVLVWNECRNGSARIWPKQLVRKEHNQWLQITLPVHSSASACMIFPIQGETHFQ